MRQAGGVADAPECVQVSLPNTSGPPENESYGGAISPDGRFVLVTSSATDVGVVDLNGGERDVFVHDMQTGAIELVSKTTAGTQVDASSGAIAITPNGRFVLMSSWGDLAGANNQLGLYLRDRQLGTTTLIVGQYFGPEVAYGDLADISDDGRYIVFVTALSFVAVDTKRRAGRLPSRPLDRTDPPRVRRGRRNAASARWARRIDERRRQLVAFMSDDLNRAGIRDIAAGTTRRFPGDTIANQRERRDRSGGGGQRTAMDGGRQRRGDQLGLHPGQHQLHPHTVQYQCERPVRHVGSVDNAHPGRWPACRRCGSCRRSYYASGYVSDSGVVSAGVGRRPICGEARSPRSTASH